MKIISFSVWDGANNYCLSLDTKAFTRKLKKHLSRYLLRYLHGAFDGTRFNRFV
ncbi:MAG: hypothetical protein ABSA06_09685 [Geobacteraceae bacterium]